MRQKVVLIKLAAMGDVVLACRALRDFTERFETDVELHWIIDQHLIALAEALLRHCQVDLEVQWHPMDSAALFRGGIKAKAAQAARMFQTVSRIRPDHLIMLHRDWRYKAILRPAFRGTFAAVSRRHVHELQAYESMFSKLARRLRADEKAGQKPPQHAAAPSNKIGILVGGAQNQKINFTEKRWPRLAELMRLIHDTTSSSIVLFGGPDDVSTAESILEKLLLSPRIINLVGKLKLHELPGAIAGLDSFVSIDSGLGHIASMVMTSPHQRVIGLFGPTDPLVWAPQASGAAKMVLHYKARPCSPCYRDTGTFTPCKFEGEYFQHCMTAITPEEVLNSLS